MGITGIPYTSAFFNGHIQVAGRQPGTNLFSLITALSTVRDEKKGRDEQKGV
jgi:hypothetical protein